MKTVPERGYIDPQPHVECLHCFTMIPDSQALTIACGYICQSCRVKYSYVACCGCGELMGNDELENGLCIGCERIAA